MIEIHIKFCLWIEVSVWNDGTYQEQNGMNKSQTDTIFKSTFWALINYLYLCII